MDWVKFLITPIFGALVGFSVWYFQSRIDKINKARQQLYDERRKVYVKILDPFIRTFAGVNNPQEMKKALNQIVSYEYKKTAFEFNLIGSDKVVKSFNDLMQYFYQTDALPDEKKNPRELVLHWGGFLLEIRKSLGDPKTKLSEIEMLRSQIRDIDNIIK